MKKRKRESAPIIHLYVVVVFSPIRFVAPSTNYIMYTVCEQLYVGLEWTGKNFYFPMKPS